MPPGMKFATVAACPVLGGKVHTVDDSAASKVAGVRKVVVHDDMAPWSATTCGRRKRAWKR